MRVAAAARERKAAKEADAVVAGMREAGSTTPCGPTWVTPQLLPPTALEGVAFGEDSKARSGRRRRRGRRRSRRRGREGTRGLTQWRYSFGSVTAVGVG
jgi:hypothetical protein